MYNNIFKVVMIKSVASKNAFKITYTVIRKSKKSTKNKTMSRSFIVWPLVERPAKDKVYGRATQI